MPRTYRKKRDQKWTEEDMINAIRLVQSGETSQYKAANMFSIPRQTLNDRLHKNVSRNVGRPCRLSQEEEKEIVDTCLLFSEWGFGIGKKEVIGVVADYCKANKKDHLFPDGVPGQEWWRAFIKRHPNLSLRKPQSLQLARARATCPEVIDHWFFQVLEPMLDKTGLKNHPERIYNADETSFCLSGRPQKVISQKGSKAPQCVIGGTGRENITIQGCISAIGQLLPPYILYSGQRLMFDYTQGGPAGAHYGVSQKGWMREVNFIDWFRNLFIPSLPDERPVMLIFDGHETHMNYEVRQLAVKHDIVIAKIPPHTTHLLQPLDLAVFKPLKEAYDRFAHLLFISERRYVTKRDFPDLVAKTWKLFKPQFAVNGFRKAGIVPFCRNAIDIQSLAPSNPFVGNPLQDLLVNENHPSESESDGDNGDSITELLGNEIVDISANIIPIYSSPTIATLPCVTPPTLPTECSVTIQATEPSNHTTVATSTIIPNIIPISHIPSTPPIPALPIASPNLPTSSTTTITEPYHSGHTYLIKSPAVKQSIHWSSRLLSPISSKNNTSQSFIRRKLNSCGRPGETKKY